METDNSQCELGQSIQRRFSALETERSSWIPHWRELSEFVQPRQARFLVTDRNKGNKVNRRILNNKATRSHRICSSGMMSGVTNPAQQWFRLSVNGDAATVGLEVREWLDDVTQLMLQAMAQSNLYTALQIAYDSETLFGTAAVGVFEDDETLFRAECYPIGSYVLANNNKGRVDTFGRKYQLTVRQVVQEFGIEQCSDSTAKMWRDGNQDTWVDVLHFIEPNRGRNTQSKLARNKPYRSIYAEPSELSKGAFLRISGFDEFPVMAARWWVTGEDVYGGSPGMNALGDIKELQYNEGKKKRAFALQVEPPVVVPMDAGDIDLAPGGVSRVASTGANAQVRAAYEVNFDTAGVRTDIEAIEQRIASAFYEDVFQAITNIQRANTREIEIQERVQERMMQMGPVLQQNNSDLYGPLIDRIFAIMWRRGALPEPPEDVQGYPLKVEYTSILQQAQRSSGTDDIEQFFSFIGNGSQLYPTMGDAVNPDKLVDTYAEKRGISPDILTSQEERDAMRQQREQQNQMQQLAQMAQPAQQLTQATKNMAELPQGGMAQ
jgi:hypothetical protein